MLFSHGPTIDRSHFPAVLRSSSRLWWGCKASIGVSSCQSLVWALCCRGEKLWTPVDNESTRNNDFVKEHFPSLATAEVLYLEREDGGDVLTPEALDKALTIHNEILALQWKNTKDENNPSAAKKVPYLPKTMGLQDLCLNTQGGEGGDDVLDCSMTNPLEMFGCVLSTTPLMLVTGHFVNNYLSHVTPYRSAQVS